MRKSLLGIALIATASCVHAPKLPAGSDAEMVSVRLSPGYGGTTFYLLEISSDGRGRLKWDVGGYPWRTGQIQYFTVPPEKFAKLSAALQAYRPISSRLLSYDDPACDFQMTDQPDIRISWAGRGPAASLLYDYGCNADKNRDLVTVLGNAPKAAVPDQLAKLPIWQIN